jgi:hypothetical protein
MGRVEPMPSYTVENTATETRSEHRTWSAAIRAAAKAGDPREVVIIERDRDGERTYNTRGQVMSRDGHFPKHAESE